jgi:hypothetical protein
MRRSRLSAGLRRPVRHRRPRRSHRPRRRHEPQPHPQDAAAPRVARARRRDPCRVLGQGPSALPAVRDQEQPPAALSSERPRAVLADDLRRLRGQAPRHRRRGSEVGDAQREAADVAQVALRGRARADPPLPPARSRRDERLPDAMADCNSFGPPRGRLPPLRRCRRGHPHLRRLRPMDRDHAERRRPGGAEDAPRGYVEALGGKLELVAWFPDGDSQTLLGGARNVTGRRRTRRSATERS